MTTSVKVISIIIPMLYVDYTRSQHFRFCCEFHSYRKTTNLFLSCSIRSVFHKWAL